MKWIITKDMHAEVGCNNVGIGNTNRAFQYALRATPREARTDMAVAFATDMTHEFRLKDDDGGVDCEGRCLDLDQQDGDHAFEPLDWAEHMYGSTTMETRLVGAKKWEVL
jgi:hypothetical protein